jgi:hypothetical protein
MITKQTELLRYINQQINQPLVVGVNDCNILALEVIDLLTGTSLAKTLKGKYKTNKKGLRLAFEAFGYTHLSKYLQNTAFEIDSCFAGIGDILVLDEEHYSCCHIHLSNGFLVADTDNKKISIQHLEAKDIKQMKAYRLNTGK